MGPIHDNQRVSTEPMKFPKVTVQPKNGSERFHDSGSLIQPTLSDFWRWGFSNVIDNTTRGVLAEFLVASALGIASGTRSVWDAYDLRLPSGLTIEVKASAYLQAWGQAKLSKPSFSIGSARAYDAATNALAPESKRQADVYVFCLETRDHLVLPVRTTRAMRRTRRFCWWRIRRSVVSTSSNPAPSAALKSSPLLSVSQPLLCAVWTMCPDNARASPFGVP